MPTITIRLTDSEKQRLEQQAQDAGCTLSAYIRDLAGPPRFDATASPHDAPWYDTQRLDQLETAVAAADQRLTALEERASREH